MIRKRNKTYKYLVECSIAVIAHDANEARRLVQSQWETANHDGDPECMNTPDVEPYSKYNKLGRARRVKFYEGGL
jgi:hypothetical protein